MTNSEIYLCTTEALDYTDRDAYVSDMALSSVWGDEPDAEIPADRIELLGRIWDRTHRTFAEIRETSGMTYRELAQRFCIPVRTMEDWSAGRRQAPLYTMLMIQEILGI